MEQQPHGVCKRTRSEQKQSHVTFKLTKRSIVRFHLTSESKGRFI